MIIPLIKTIDNHITEMLENNNDAIEKYNMASWQLDDAIRASVENGLNPHTIEIDNLETSESQIFWCSYNKILNENELIIF